MKSFLQKILSVFLFLVVICCSISIVQKIVWKDKTPSIFGIKNYVVLSGSMYPTIEIGDIVFVKETTDIHEKDIIAFRVGESVVTHRVVEKVKDEKGTYYRTKGDANNSADAELVKASEVEGKYVFRFGKIGKILLFLKSKVGIVFFVSCFLIYFYLSKSTKIKDRFVFGSWEESNDKHSK